MALAVCHPEKRMYGHGMCEACYWRWYRNERPERKVYDRENLHKWYAAHPGEYRLAMVRKKLKQYSLTPDQYSVLLKEQDGLCAICGQSETVVKNGNIQSLSVDHDEASGRVRGLLCNSCNNGIGRLNHDPERLRRAAEYLERSELSR